MSVLFIAVPAALAFAISAVIAFVWAARSGQLDDLETPPLRMLQDDAPPAVSPGQRSGQRSGEAPRARDGRPTQH